VTYRDRSQMRPLVRMFDSASHGSSGDAFAHPRWGLVFAKTNAKAPSADMLSALDDTIMLQHLNRGHRARNEHRAASPTINVNDLKHCGAFREASPEIAAQLSGASKPPPPAAPCPGGIFAAVASRDRHRRPAGHSPALKRHAGSITGAAAHVHSSRPFPLLRARPRLRFTYM
jgi:hypothetical protein